MPPAIPITLAGGWSSKLWLISGLGFTGGFTLPDEKNLLKSWQTVIKINFFVSLLDFKGAIIETEPSADWRYKIKKWKHEIERKMKFEEMVIR